MTAGDAASRNIHLRSRGDPRREQRDAPAKFFTDLFPFSPLPSPVLGDGPQKAKRHQETPMRSAPHRRTAAGPGRGHGCRQCEHREGKRGGELRGGELGREQPPCTSVPSARRSGRVGERRRPGTWRGGTTLCFGLRSGLRGTTEQHWTTPHRHPARRRAEYSPAHDRCGSGTPRGYAKDGEASRERAPNRVREGRKVHKASPRRSQRLPRRTLPATTQSRGRPIAG